MPLYIECLSDEVRNLLTEVLPADQKPLVAAVPACPVGVELQVSQQAAQGEGKKGKRAPGPYAMFVKECFATKKAAGEDTSKASEVMKACSVQWRQKKAK